MDDTLIGLFNQNIYAEVVAGLNSLGYFNQLLKENYKFRDWFEGEKKERVASVVAFGQTPVSYESALIGVVVSNGLRESTLVNQYRALGAPIILEIDTNEVREWAISRKENSHRLIERHSADQIRQLFVKRANDWKPEPLLRAKNIGAFHGTQQLSLFSGLLPELEERIQQILEPLLENVLSKTKLAYEQSTGIQPNPSELFKLIFWVLTAKVFFDRSVDGFKTLTANSEKILSAIARQYKSKTPVLLNQKARDVAVSYIWNELDFRNLSVEVLSQMWSTMLIDKDTRRKMGIHRTSRTIVNYIIEKIPFQQSGDSQKIIFEPCTGSAVFLIGVMNALRPKLFGMSDSERHNYFIKHFVGVEQDPFGVEISRLALTLADFPNLGGWNIIQDDIFREGSMSEHLKRSGIVLCNPPYADFGVDERKDYNLTSPLKPVELINRILNDLHPSGVLGLVLPRNILDGNGYKDVRRRLAERFATIDLTALPDKAFDADTEVGLLVATEPIPHNTSRVVFSKVNDKKSSWEKFAFLHEVSSKHIVELNPLKASESLAVADLPDVWNYLKGYSRLGDIAKIHRGISWNLPLTDNGNETGNRRTFVREESVEGFMLGVAPLTKFNVFSVPNMLYLDKRESSQTGGAYKYEWNKPKVILNKSARSRGHWRISAFPDSVGVIAYQSFIGVWSKTPLYDEIILSAILNSPIANAFVATREGKTDITIETLKKIPIPRFTEQQKERLKSLIKSYQHKTNPNTLFIETLSDFDNISGDAEQFLKQIDALVLDGYKMPPRLERQVLDFFNSYGEDRPVEHNFDDYVPSDCESYFSLSTHLSPKFQRATVGNMLNYLGAMD